MCALQKTRRVDSALQFVSRFGHVNSAPVFEIVCIMFIIVTTWSINEEEVWLMIYLYIVWHELLQIHVMDICKRSVNSVGIAIYGHERQRMTDGLTRTLFLSYWTVDERHEQMKASQAGAGTPCTLLNLPGEAILRHITLKCQTTYAPEWSHNWNLWIHNLRILVGNA